MNQEIELRPPSGVPTPTITMKSANERPDEIDIPVVVDVPGCNSDPLLWGPDADKWRPERWLEPLPREVEDARIPGVYSHL